MKSFDQEKSRKSIKNQKVKSLTFILRKFSKCFSMVFSKLWKGITQNFTYKLKKTSNMKVVDFDPMNNFDTYNFFPKDQPFKRYGASKLASFENFTLNFIFFKVHGS